MQNTHVIPPAESRSLGSFWAAQPSGIIREMLRTAANFALSDLGVRIVGEYGTGKRYLAMMIHRESPRSAAPFRRINCAILSPDQAEKSIFGFEDSTRDGQEQTRGILETSRGGTAYFDFCETLPLEVRNKFLRAIELRYFRRVGGSDDLTLDVKVITGMTKYCGLRGRQGTEHEVAESKPGPVSVNIPPLRERREDIESLIYLFLSEYSGQRSDPVTQITAEALNYCKHYSWPGNIYELRNVIQHSLSRAAGGVLRPVDLPEYIKNEAVERDRSSPVVMTARG